MGDADLLVNLSDKREAARMLEEALTSSSASRKQ